MKHIYFKRIATVAVALLMCLTALFVMTNCGGDSPESSTPESTPDATPDAKSFNITYDLDGGIDGGNPTTYTNDKDLKLIVPIRIGYDFVGWTGTGVTDPTVSVTVAKGTEGDLSFKANWVEDGEFEIKIDNTTEDIFGKVYFGTAKATIVTNYAMNASNKLMTEEIQKFFEKNKQIIKIVRDESVGNITSVNDFMFYVGFNKCAPSQEFLSTLNPAQYGVAVNEDNICYIAWTEDANAAAKAIYDEIVDHVMAGGSISDFAGGRYVGQVEGQVGADVPMPDVIDAGTDVGEGAFQLYTLDTTKEVYDAYLAKLEAAGYTCYTTNVMAGKVYCATYTKDNTVVNVQFSNGDPNGKLEFDQGKTGMTADRSMRIIVEPLSNTALPAIEKPDDADAKVTVSSVTLMHPHYLCVVIQLSNGHFVILDSGNNGTQKALSDFLRAKAPDGKPVIEAWIFSHFHQDHIGGFVDYMGVSSLTRYITIKSIIYNFPSERTYLTAHKSGTDMNNMKLWYEKRIPALREKGTTIYQARTGQKYYFGNAEIEILWTFEDLAPFNIFEDVTNPTSIGFSVTIEGQKITLTGDSSEEEFRVVAAKYGDYLKSDILQLSHHGYGNGGGYHTFYKLVDAPILFHPQPDTTLYPSLGGNEKTAIENAQLVIRSGNYGKATLKLPFTIGDNIESDFVPKNEPEDWE